MNCIVSYSMAFFLSFSTFCLHMHECVYMYITRVNVLEIKNYIIHNDTNFLAIDPTIHFHFSWPHPNAHNEILLFFLMTWKSDSWLWLLRVNYVGQVGGSRISCNFCGFSFHSSNKCCFNLLCLIRFFKTIAYNTISFNCIENV